LVEASKETGLKVIIVKSKYMLVSRDQNAGLSQNVKINNGSCKRVKKFVYFGRTFFF